MTAVASMKHGTDLHGPFPDFAAASAFYCAKRDQSGLGASQFPPALLYSPGGVLLGNISYNGRVWAGLPQSWRPGVPPLYAPDRAAA